MSKADKLKARLPRGFADRGAGDLAATERMLAAIRETYELYGFEALETPFVEYTDALGKFLPDQDRPNEGVFSFQDDDEQWLSLRYDLTAPLARHVAEGLDAQKLSLPYRSYRAGWVFRNEKPGPGRFRQFMQFDADTVGSASPAADAEMCMMMADTLERLGIQRGDYVIKVSNRKVLEGLFEAVGISGDDKTAQRMTVLRAIDKLDRLGPEEVIKLLGPGRKDESGDVTKGAGLPDKAINAIINFTGWGKKGTGAGSSLPDAMGAELTTANMDDIVGNTSVGAEGIAELRAIRSIVTEADYGGRIIIDPSVVRGLEYYTGPVFEAELNFETPNEQGQPVRFGSVGGGGRYDGLVGRFRGEPVPATGFSIGVSRLFAALKAVGSPIVTGARKPGPVLVLVMDRDRIADYQRMVSALRQADIRAELYLGSAGMKAQMKYADRRGSPCAIIQGSQERDTGVVQIKDLIEGTEQAAAREGADVSNADYRAARLAQSEVPESDLVEAVGEILARHFQ